MEDSTFILSAKEIYDSTFTVWEKNAAFLKLYESINYEKQQKEKTLEFLKYWLFEAMHHVSMLDKRDIDGYNSIMFTISRAFSDKKNFKEINKWLMENREDVLIRVFLICD